MITPLTLEESQALLRNSRTGHLGCVDDGGPYIVPVHYIFEDDSIYIHSQIGRKITALRANPRACLQVDDVTDELHWRSVLAFGAYDEITDQNERERILQKLLALFPHLTPVESLKRAAAQSPIIVFGIRIDRVTGVSEGRPPRQLTQTN